MKTALITGANKGIGLATARQLAREGVYVYIGSRDLQNGLKVVETLKAEGINNVTAIQLDVTSQQSVDSARAEIGTHTELLDILVNNAGIGGVADQNSLTCSVDAIKEVFETNFYGPIRVTQAFVDLLQKSNEARIVNVTSGLASLTVASDTTHPFYPFKATAYQSSKTALNMYTVNLAFDLRDTKIKVNAVCPGFTGTDINNHQGPGTVEEAAQRIIKYTSTGDEVPTGKFFCEEHFPNSECPW